MALHFDYSRLADKSVMVDPDTGDWTSLGANAPLWLACIELREISEKTVQEAFIRLSVLEAIEPGPLFRTKDGPGKITPELVRSLIGLSANVATRPRAGVLSRLLQGRVSDAVWSWRDGEERRRLRDIDGAEASGLITPERASAARAGLHEARIEDDNTPAT